MANPLDPVLVWYNTTRDGMRVTRRVVQTGITRAITSRHVFFRQTQADNLTALDEAQRELDRVVVLALTAVFGRALRDHLSALPVVAAPTGNPQHDAVRTDILKDVEFWNISSRVLDLFPTVAPVLRGQVKQIIDYRNWVAHGWVASRPPPVQTDPADAYQRLTDFLTQAGVVVP